MLLPAPSGSTKRAYIDRLVELGFDQDDARTIYSDTTDLHYWSQSGGSAHFLEYLSDLYATPWFSFEGLKGIVVARIGSLAGTSFADLLFTMAVSKVYKAIRTMLVNEDMTTDICIDFLGEVFGKSLQDFSPSSVRLAKLVCELSFVDDTAVALYADPHGIVNKVQKALGNIDTIFLSFGLKLNYKRGKTEVFIEFRGKGADAARKAFHNNNGGVVVFTNDLGETKELLSTDLYKHVGSKRARGGNLMPEVIYRSQCMMSALRDIRPKILRTTSISIRDKLLLVGTYLLSRGLYQAGTWRLLHIGEARTFHGNLMKVFRAVLRLDRPTSARMSDNEIIAELNIYSPLNLVAALRIALFKRVMSKGSLPLLAILSCNYQYEKYGGWLAAVQHNLHQLALASDKLEECNSFTIGQWAGLCTREGHRAYKTIQHALALPEVNDIRFWWPKPANAKGGEHNPAPPADPQVFTCDCGECTYICESVQALSWHKYDKHGVQHEARKYITTTFCECCLTDFHSRSRILTHVIQSSARCRAFYSQVATRAPDEVTDKLDSKALELTRSLKRAGRRRAYANTPPERLCGPLTPQAHRLGVSHSLLLKCPPCSAALEREDMQYSEGT